MDRAVPIWGRPEDGKAPDQSFNTTPGLERAALLTQYRGRPDAYISMAATALVTAESLAALRAPLFITRLPTTDSACARGMAEAVPHHLQRRARPARVCLPRGS